MYIHIGREIERDFGPASHRRWPLWVHTRSQPSFTVQAIQRI